MSYKHLLLPLFIAVAGQVIQAQELKFGVRAGMNMSTIRGELETDDNGKEVESYDWASGFHVGFTVTWPATELMGLRSELLFIQLGADRFYDGPSYYIFQPDTEPVYAFGSSKINLRITNSYLNLPITGYVRPLKWLEFFAGGNIGFLISSTAFGDITFEGVSTSGVPVSLRHELDYRYFIDNPAQATYITPVNTVTIGGEKIPYPHVGRAQFMFAEDRGSLYRVLELGGVAGLSFYLNSGLYLSARANVGFTDVTKEKADVSYLRLDDNNNFITRNDKDTNLSLQASIGFHF